MKWLYSLIIFMVFTGGVAAGHQWRDQSARLEQLQYEKEYNAALAQAQQQARQREQSLQRQLELLSDQTQQQLDEVITLERAVADNRVRELVQQYAAGNRTGTDSPTANGCQTERTRARMLAELLTELNELATIFAAEADRNKIAGKACEAAYVAVSIK